MKTIKITRNSKNLAFGWSNTPLRNKAEIESVESPSVVGNWRVVCAELDRARRINSGGVWFRFALFVGGKRVQGPSWEITAALAGLESDGHATVEVE
jgi:hypothetical protein